MRSKKEGLKQQKASETITRTKKKELLREK